MMTPRTLSVLLAAAAIAMLLAVAYDILRPGDLPNRSSGPHIDSHRTVPPTTTAPLRAAILALPAAFPRTETFDFATPLPGSYELPPIKSAPDAVLLDHTGSAVELGGLWAGRVSLVSFVYLTCTDESGCPLAMSVLYDIEFASRTNAVLRDQVQLVTISFDPVRDPPAALAAFVAPKAQDIADRRVLPWRVLTGKSEDSIAPMLAAFGQRVDKERNSERLNHLLRMYLVDPSGRIRNIYGLGTIDPRLIMADIATLLLEGATQ